MARVGPQRHRKKNIYISNTLIKQLLTICQSYTEYFLPNIRLLSIRKINAEEGSGGGGA